MSSGCAATDEARQQQEDREMTEREAALEEAIAACTAREQYARSRVVGNKHPLQVNVFYIRATEARDCAEAIMKLKGEQK